MNNIKKYGVALLTLSSVSISTYFTCIFMVALGQSLEQPLIFGALAVVFEGSKIWLSSDVAEHYRSARIGSSVATSIPAVALMAVSIAASTFIIDNSANSSRVESSSYNEITQLIKSKKTLAAAQVSIGHITKSSETLKDIESLIVTRSTLPSENMISSIDKNLALAFSVLFELINVLTIMKMSFLWNKTQPNTARSQSNTVNINTPVVKVCRPNESNTLTIAARDTHYEIKAAIVSGMVVPSHRGISATFAGVSREIIKSCLDELAAANVIRRFRNGWTLA